MPSITIWNRIEPRSRSFDLQTGLEARVHDPLWLLLRQWQVGEFEGRNTGSPVTVTVQSTVAPFDRYSINGQPPLTYGSGRPIEAIIEQETVRPSVATDDFRQASEAGLYFLRLLAAASLPAAISSAYLAHYPLTSVSGNAQTISSIVAGRVIDGIKLHSDLVAAGNNLPLNQTLSQTLSDAQKSALTKVMSDWMAWYDTLFLEPAKTDGWSSDRMEYSFAIGAAANPNAYTAKEYDGGSVEWFTFNQSSTPIAGGTAQPVNSSKSVITTPVTFRGMPARRFWEMEDASVNVAELSAAAEDLGRILLREFALVYGNDWFQFPLQVPVGSQTNITALTVADTFGVNTTIDHYSVVDGAQGQWRMFNPSLDTTAAGIPSPSTHPLLLPPGAVSIVDGSPVEEVMVLRDELANMVWGIERTVSGASGQPYDRTTVWNTSLPVVPPPSAGALPSYRLGSTVPDYWVPFLPVKGKDPSGQVKLVRGKLPTSTTGALGRMLGETNSGFLLEEVPQEGIHLVRRYRVARGLDGSTYSWIGRLRSIGKGEGRSGLQFDFLE
jgi:hypothetical protein